MFTVDDNQSNFEGFVAGTLLYLNHNLGAGILTKKLLKEVITHFGQVAYIDVYGKKGHQVTIRFGSKALSEGFLTKAADTEDRDIEALVGQQVKVSDAFLKLLVRQSGSTISEDDARRMTFTVLKKDECSKYQKVAQKQKQGYTKYLSEKRHICVKDIIAKRRQDKTAGKLADQLDRQKI